MCVCVLEPQNAMVNSVHFPASLAVTEHSETACAAVSSVLRVVGVAQTPELAGSGRGTQGFFSAHRGSGEVGFWLGKAQVKMKGVKLQGPPFRVTPAFQLKSDQPRC